MNKKLLLVSFIFFNFHSGIYSQGIGIGTTTPNSSAMLDVQSNNKGMLVPRMALTASNVAAPVTTPADALLIYNTATVGTGINGVIPGFYYWSSTSNRWNPMKESSSDGTVGYGPWGDCRTNAVSEYNPLVDETGEEGDRFGVSVSISGDYAIAGAYFDNIGSVGRQGSATISRYNGTNWVTMQKITDAAGGDDAWFGHSVSISGNYAIVGVPRGDVGASLEQGFANIYHFNDTEWVFMQKLIDPGGIAEDWFGYSVSISGNYAVAGIYRDDIGAGPEQGSVCVYQFNGTG